MGRTACADAQCLYSTAIPLFPLWAVRPVQTLSACRVQLELYSTYGPYGLCRASVPVQYSYTSIPIRPYGLCRASVPVQYSYTPIPTSAVRPLQILSDCTVQLHLYSPLGRTACAEPQCLYSKATLLFPIWAVRPVQTLNASRVQLYLYSTYGPYGL